MRHISDLM